MQKLETELWQVHYDNRLGSYLISESDESQWCDDIEAMSFPDALAKLIDMYETELARWQKPTPEDIAKIWGLSQDSAAELIADVISDCERMLAHIRNVKTPDEYVEAFEKCRGDN